MRKNGESGVLLVVEDTLRNRRRVLVLSKGGRTCVGEK